MDEMAARYDRRARTYGRCWAPVLAPAALALLDVVGEVLARPAARLLDAGTGTGTLAIAAAARFPGLTVTGLDVSGGMLARAREAASGLDAGVRERIDFVEGAVEAAIGPLVPPATFDAVVSSFLVQLVPDRGALLRALRDALRPGGVLALVTWADDAKPVAPEAAWETSLREVLDETGTPAPAVPNPPRAGPIPTPDAARRELAAAGFVDITATTDELVHRFGRDGGRSLIVDYDHAAELDALAPGVSAAVLARLDARLATLPDDAFAWRAPLIRATGRRPDAG